MNHARESSRILAGLLRSEHGAMADFLVALADFDRQRLWLRLGHSSLFYYLHRELGLSKGAAHFRKVAAQLVQQFPEVIEPLRDGRLCISSVVELARVMTPENRVEAMPRSFHRSKREAKEVAMEIRPVAVIPRKEVVMELPRSTAVRLDEPDSALPEIKTLEASGTSVASETPPLRPQLTSPPTSQLTSEPLTSELRRLHMTVSKQFLEKLEAARNGQGHAQPGASAEKVLEAALDLLLATQAKRRAEVKRPQQNPRPARNPCHVSAAVKRAVWARDEGKCQFPLDSGGICGSTLRLEIDHVPPLARGGASTVDGCRLLCRVHNQYAARQVYGDEWMDRFTNGNAITAPYAREPAATWSYGEEAVALILSRRGARCDEVSAGAPRTEQARARCASVPYSLDRLPPRTCSEEQSALPRRRPGTEEGITRGSLDSTSPPRINMCSMPTLLSRTSVFRCGSALALALLIAAAGAAGAAPQPSFSPAEKAAMARITAAEISGHTRFLADDLLDGRFPGSRGELVGIRYLATQLETMGYQPGVPGQDGKPASWFQPVPLVKYTTTIPADITFKRGAESLVLPTGPGLKAEVAVRSIGDTDHVDVRNAGLVFVGYGIVAPEFGWDDYRGVDVKGKIVVLLNFNPPFAGEGVRVWYGRWDYKFAEAARHGAVGALLVHTTESASYPWQVVVSSNRAEAFALPPEGEARLDFQGWISREGVGRLFQLAGLDFAAAEIAAKDPKTKGAPSMPLGVTASLDMPVKRERIESANVIGILPGTDPKLKAEAVLYTAHHDHLGMRNPPVPGERNVYSGALDNASGCAVVLTVARAAVASPPKRSVVVAFVTAEEQGLLGSRYFAKHPTLPVGRIAVDINLDGINNKGRTSDIGVIGLGKSTVDDVIRSLAAAQGRTVHGDSFPDRGSFYRSDSFELAQVGVPVARIGGGPHFVGRPEKWGIEQQELYERHDYHQPSDAYPPSPEAWDLTGAVEDAQLQLLLGLRIGNTPAMPTWTKGDEFEKYRLAALSSDPAPVLRKRLPERVPETNDAAVIGEVPAKVLDTVKADLAKRTGARAEAMSVVRSEELVFSDGSLGCGRPGQVSTQALVPGYRVVLSLDGKQYDYRVTRQGAFTLCEQGPRAR